MSYRKFLVLLILFFSGYTHAQVTGVVLDEHGEPLIGANVYWAGTSIGVATDFQGNFSLMPPSGKHQEPLQLVASFVGCHNDTTEVKDRTPLTIVLVDEAVLDEITITERKMGVLKSRTSAFDTQTIGTEELCRAACCNLSEAFETNASVDVAYSDAATGAKQIRLLGLSGTYVQLIQENTPAVRGLAQTFGMEYIPGPWMSSIQVSKGTSSVINGYEATSGQINVELLKPQTQNPLSVNLMVNTETMAEANIMGGWKIPLKEEEHTHHHHVGEADEHEHCHHESLYTGIMAHYGQNFMAMDENHDSFVDMPRVRNANLANRWFYKHGDYTFQAFARGLYDKRVGGQMANDIVNPYHIDLNTWRVEGFLKNGYVFDDESGSSVAIITAVSYHDLDNSYGEKAWKANQLNAYLNAICQLNFEGGGLIDNDHRLSMGLSVNYDKYNERYTPAAMSAETNLDRQELTPGIFAEYSYKYAEMLSLVAGVRADYSTQYGFFATPRMNIRYTPFEWWTLRGSVGMGYRSPNAISDNSFLLPSTRAIHLTDTVKQERAVNAGISMTFYIPLGSRQLQLSTEYYYTHFLNSLIVDLDHIVSDVYIFNQSDVNGAKSFAHCAQIEASMEVLRGWTISAAFRYNDVRQTTYLMQDGMTGTYMLREKVLQNRFKGIVSMSYQTPLKKWQFDVTAQFNGPGRMPDGIVYDGYQFSPQGQYPRLSENGQYYTNNNGMYHSWYPQLMAQITKYFRTCSIYVGAENMTNFRQDHPIAGWYDAQGHVQTDGMPFDASSVWGPTTGWKIYVGFRYDLEKKD